MLDPAFVEDCPYGPDALLIDSIETIDRDASRIVATMATSAELPITRDQRTHPTRHPRHVSGGLLLHVSGIMGFAHAYFVLDLRHRDGWIGYGTHIHGARFRRMATVDAPLELACTATSVRRIRGAIVARYSFLFRQGGDAVYEGDQTAMFTQVP